LEGIIAGAFGLEARGDTTKGGGAALDVNPPAGGGIGAADPKPDCPGELAGAWGIGGVGGIGPPLTVLEDMGVAV
jgi:hypothetical protein